MRVEQGQQLFVQAACDESLTEAADRRFIGHSFVRVELHKFLKAQPILELLLGLRGAQSVEVLQNHDAQQDADTARRTSTPRCK